MNEAYQIVDNQSNVDAVEKLSSQRSGACKVEFPGPENVQVSDGGWERLGRVTSRLGCEPAYASNVNIHLATTLHPQTQHPKLLPNDT